MLGAVLGAAGLAGGAVVGPVLAGPGGGGGQVDAAPAAAREPAVGLFEHDGFGGAQVGVVQAAVEGFQVLAAVAVTADGGEQAGYLGRVRDHAPASYMRMFAGLCDVAARLLRFDAAERDADIDQASAHKTAASRRAAHLETELAKRFAPDDPLASVLASAAAAVKGIKSEDISSVLASWAALPMPVLIVDGPRPIRRPDGNPAEETRAPARRAEPAAPAELGTHHVGGGRHQDGQGDQPRSAW